MATVVIPAHEVQACDVCGKGNRISSRCIVCDCECCYACEVLPNAASPYVKACRKCSYRQDVQSVLQKHESIIQAAIAARGDELRALRK